MNVKDAWTWGLIVLLMLGFVAYAISAGADIGWDVRNYHLYNGYHFLHGGYDGSFFPAQIQSYTNPIQDAALVFLIEHLPPVGVGMVIASFQSLVVPLLYLLSRSLLPTSFAVILAVMAAITAPMTISELGTSFGDLTSGVFVIAAVVVITRQYISHDKRGIFLAGLCAGLAMGLKLTNLIYMPGFLILIVLTPKKPNEIIRQTGLFLGITALGFALSGGAWSWHLWQQADNPLFPFLNGIFQSPLIRPDNMVADDRFMPKTWVDFILFPLRTATGDHPGAEVSFADPRFIIMCAVLPVLAFRRPTRTTAGLILFFVSSMVLWLTLFGIERYVVVLETLAPVLMFAVIAMVLQGREQIIAIFLITAATVTLTSYPDWKNRAAWGVVSADNLWFDVKVPARLQQLNTGFILLGDEPTSYVIPAFPASDRFIRLGGNFRLQPDTLLDHMRNKAITGFSGPIWSISPTFPARDELDKLRSLGWQRSPDGCLPLQTLVETLQVCPLQLIPHSATAP